MPADATTERGAALNRVTVNARAYELRPDGRWREVTSPSSCTPVTDARLADALDALAYRTPTPPADAALTPPATVPAMTILSLYPASVTRFLAALDRLTADQWRAAADAVGDTEPTDAQRDAERRLDLAHLQAPERCRDELDAADRTLAALAEARWPTDYATGRLAWEEAWAACTLLVHHAAGLVLLADVQLLWAPWEPAVPLAPLLASSEAV